MELQVRRNKTIHDQENVHVQVLKGKGSLALPAKKQGLGVRGALGDINTNVQITREANVGKVACATAEFEKKATLNRGAVKFYSHVQSKVDTGLVVRSVVNPSSKPPLRREESTAGHATRAIARTRSLKENRPVETKESINTNNPTKKTEKKTTKLPAVKENKEARALKPILKESTKSLGKLKLAEDSTSGKLKQKGQFTVIDHAKLQKQAAQLHEILDTTPELPDDIEDIDAADYQSPLLMSIYIKDIYRYLTELEVKYAIEPDHLKKHTEITGRMRATLIDWLVEVQRQFSLVHETFHLTVGILDRYLQAVPNVRRSRLQLVGVTAMFIASKYEEIYAPDVSDFVYVTDKAFSKADVLTCERDMMSKLGFSLARPIPLSFLRRFVKAAGGTSKNHHLAKYFVDLALLEYSMAHYRPSELAAAAVCLSLYLLSSKPFHVIWTPTMVYYSGYSFDKLQPIIRHISNVVMDVNNSKFKSVYNKYSDQSLAKVATLPQLKSDAIIELASPILDR